MTNLKEQLQERVDRAISDKVFPGCSIGVITSQGEFTYSWGHQTYEKEKKVKEDTIYDISSITKGVATAGSLLSLIDDGKISLDDKVVDYLPEFDTSSEKREVTIEHLLTYTVDLKVPATSELLAMPIGEAIEALLKSELRHPAGKEYLYTNVIALLIGLIVQRVTDNRLDKFSQERFFTPLEMERTTFHPEKFSLDEIAPTEKKDRIGRTVHGKVHDESTFLLQEKGYYLGISGLFSTTPDLLHFLSILLNKGEYEGRRFFSQEIIENMFSVHYSDSNYTAGLGWELAAKRYLGEGATEHTFGRTGFTGCLMAGNSKRNAGFVLLSNHIYPHRRENSDAINEVRHDIADIVWQYVDNLKS